MLNFYIFRPILVDNYRVCHQIALGYFFFLKWNFYFFMDFLLIKCLFSWISALPLFISRVKYLHLASQLLCINFKTACFLQFLQFYYLAVYYFKAKLRVFNALFPRKIDHPFIPQQQTWGSTTPARQLESPESELATATPLLPPTTNSVRSSPKSSPDTPGSGPPLSMS